MISGAALSELAADELCIGALQYSDDSSDGESIGETPSLDGGAALDDVATTSPLPASQSPPPSTPPKLPPGPAPIPAPPVCVCRAASDPTYEVTRWHWSTLSVAAFRAHCAASRCPLIITGLGPHLAPRGLSLERLRALLPADMAVPVRGHGTMSAASFFGRLDAGEALYLADVPLAIHFPWLFDEVAVPAYFLHDFAHRTRRRLSIMHDTPSLFVGGAGTTSALHVDQMCSNFWMYLGEGAKRWITFHPDDAPLLSPTWDAPEQIHRFAPLAQLESDAQSAASLRQARRLEFELRAGEVLYIPHNTPHEVTNLAATCAVSANYLDQTNVELSLAQGTAKLATPPASPCLPSLPFPCLPQPPRPLPSTAFARARQCATRQSARHAGRAGRGGVARPRRRPRRARRRRQRRRRGLSERRHAARGAFCCA